MKTYFGKQTEQAIQNFPFPLPLVSLDLIYAIVEVKKACARANFTSGLLDVATSKAIEKACEEILTGKLDDQFVTCSLQGGAGTSINMNVNEVLANRAQTFLKQKITVHPNDHVNLSQSTNDVNPSALRILSIRLNTQLVKSLNKLIRSIEQKAKKYKKVWKLGRTHLQDAIPITVHDELMAYKAMLERNKKRLQEAQNYLFELNLGGTAVGNGMNANRVFQREVYRELKKITKLKVISSREKVALTGSSSDFVHMSNAVMLLSNDLSKIAHDIRLLASGPKGGIGEYQLKELQAGSSIMPGKVNPVIPEALNQVYYFVSGKNVTIQQAAEGACLELSIMFPVIADSLITSFTLLDSVINQFTHEVIVPLVINIERMRELLEKSTAYATLLTPKLGYDVVSSVVKEAIKTNRSIREVVLSKELLSEEEFDSIVS